MVDNMRYMLAILVLLFGCIQPPAPTAGTSGENTTQFELPQTELPPEIPALPPDYTVGLGDTVWVNYILWVKGEVVDTNNETLAKEVGIYNPGRIYEPFQFQVVFDKDVINGFVMSVIGMSINETLTFSVEPKYGYGPYEPTKVFIIPRYYTKSNYEVVPRELLEGQGLEISNGTSYNTPQGMVFINDFNEENVTLFYMFMPGSTFMVNGIPQRINSTNSENFTAKIEFMLEENGTYILPNPQTGVPAQYTITSKTDQNISLDGNHPLANETLKFQVTLIKAQPYSQ